MFSVGVFSHMLQIDDALIGVMSCVSKILAGFVYAFATTDFVFYLGEFWSEIRSIIGIKRRTLLYSLHGYIGALMLGKIRFPSRKYLRRLDETI